MKQNSIFMFGLSQFDNIEAKSLYILPKDKKKIREELESIFNLSSESIFDDLPGFSYEANGTNIPISHKIFERRKCFDVGRRLYKQGEYAIAIKYYNKNIHCKDPANLDCICDHKKSCNSIDDVSIFFERGKCYYQLIINNNNNQNLALNDFEKVLSLIKPTHKLLNIVNNYKLILLCILEKYEHAYEFCDKLIKNEKIRISEKKEFYFGALELSILLADDAKYDIELNRIRLESKLKTEHGDILLYFFECIHQKIEYGEFERNAMIKIRNIKTFEPQLNWGFDNILAFVRKDSDINRLLICQKMIEIQQELLDNELKVIENKMS
ncbi:MAG: hypothetical protein Q8861_02405 [Bacteroidota bacterium]|nr:hypothetical protein [Bacteroidota bacterium]